MPGGRPTKYDPRRSAKVIEAIRAGETTDDAAQLAGVAPSTLYAWRVAVPAFREALDRVRLELEERRIREFRRRRRSA